jgi:hypothetical protein
MGASVTQIDYVDKDNLSNLLFEYIGNIAAFASITLKVRRPDGTSVIKTAIIDDAAKGKFHFEWASGDLIIGVNEARVKLEITAGNVLSLPKPVPLSLIVSAEV